MTSASQFLQEDRVAIFLFHGVIRAHVHPVRNYTRKHIDIPRFTQILEDLAAHGRPVSIDEFVKSSRNRITLPPRSFLISFDDGFENNHSMAAPILRRLQIPAIFYVTTSFIDQNGCSWIDEIEYAVEKIASFELNLPRLDIRGHFSTDSSKIGLLNTIRAQVKAHRDVDPYAISKEVWLQLGIDRMEQNPELDQKMNWRQLIELQRDELFTIGGHSHTHRILEYLDDRELKQEIGLSLKLLRDHLGPIRHYSYPEGLASCFSDRVIRLLQQEGILCAPSAEPGTNRPGDSLFHLKRIMLS